MAKKSDTQSEISQGPPSLSDELRARFNEILANDEIAQLIKSRDNLAESIPRQEAKAALLLAQAEAKSQEAQQIEDNLPNLLAEGRDPVEIMRRKRELKLEVVDNEMAAKEITERIIPSAQIAVKQADERLSSLIKIHGAEIREGFIQLLDNQVKRVWDALMSFDEAESSFWSEIGLHYHRPARIMLALNRLDERSSIQKLFSRAPLDLREGERVAPATPPPKTVYELDAEKTEAIRKSFARPGTLEGLLNVGGY